jgi:hypothetical protein
MADRRTPGSEIAVRSDLVEEIRNEHAQAATAARTAIGHAMRCGQLLAEAKAAVPHGEWGGWLDENFPSSRRTAQGYMRLARVSETQDLASMGIEAALRQIAAPSQKTETEAEVAEEIEDDDRFVMDYEDIAAVSKLARTVEPRSDLLAILGVYMRHHHDVRPAGRVEEIRTVCAIIGVVPLIKKVPANADGIENVWIGFMDGDLLKHDPEWLDYCEAACGPDDPLIRALREELATATTVAV